jgi:hypothetical protein
LASDALLPSRFQIGRSIFRFEDQEFDRLGIAWAQSGSVPGDLSHAAWGRDECYAFAPDIDGRSVRLATQLLHFLKPFKEPFWPVMHQAVRSYG